MLKGSADVSICKASAKRLFLSRVAHSWSHSSLKKQDKVYEQFLCAPICWSSQYRNDNREADSSGPVVIH